MWLLDVRQSRPVFPITTRQGTTTTGLLVPCVSCRRARAEADPELHVRQTDSAHCSACSQPCIYSHVSQSSVCVSPLNSSLKSGALCWARKAQAWIGQHPVTQWSLACIFEVLALANLVRSMGATRRSFACHPASFLAMSRCIPTLNGCFQHTPNSPGTHREHIFLRLRRDCLKR